MPPPFWAVGTLTIERFDLEQRTIEGWATTPTPDRRGDIVDPLGVIFSNPIPLLLYHDTERPIGLAWLGVPTARGVPFTAKIAHVTDAGIVRARIEEAWQSIKAGILRAVSIGLRPIAGAVEAIKSGGLHYRRSELVELSLVTVPANLEATITVIKSLDLPYRAARGVHLAGVSAASDRGSMEIAPPIAETIQQWETSRANDVARMQTLLDDARRDNRTLDVDGAQQFEALKRNVETTDAHLERLRTQEALERGSARPLSPGPIAAPAIVPSISVKSIPLPKATAFTRMAQAIGAAGGDKRLAAEIAHKHWKDSTPEVELALKAAVAAGTTTDATWAAPLVPPNIASEFLELVRAATILGKLSRVRRVPFNCKVPRQTAGGSYGWVGEGKAKPVTKLAFDTVVLGITKAAGIIVLTDELVRFSNPSAESVVRADMVAGIAAFLDAQFIDPAVAAVAGVNPASITNGAPNQPSSGGTPNHALADLTYLMTNYKVAKGSLSNAVIILSETNAFALASAVTSIGQPAFPNMTPTGGSILGLRVVASDTAGSNVIMADETAILMADDDGVTIDMSREASLQMDSAPLSPPDATTVMVSLWQQNMVGLRVERFINWVVGRTGSVSYVTGASYALGPTPAVV